MTAQEVIKELQVAYLGDTEDIVQAKHIAIKALEKQIPKKPDFEGDGYWNGELVYDTWICPCCGKHYEVDYEEYDCCPKCGQKIDWDEEGV